MQSKLTKKIIDATSSADKDTIIWDTELKGFGFKITSADKRSYFLYYRTRDGRQRRPKIGDHGVITCEQAKETTHLLKEVYYAAIQRLQNYLIATCKNMHLIKNLPAKKEIKDLVRCILSPSLVILKFHLSQEKILSGCKKLCKRSMPIACLGTVNKLDF